MGFFFTQQATEAKRNGKRGLRNAGTTKQNAQTLQRLGCAACPLNNADVDTPKMQPTLANQTDVYFLAEAPGAHEDETSHKPLTGPSGELLRSVIPDGEEDYCSFDNVVRDRPPKNRTPTWQEIECCRNHIVKSIEEAKPRFIVGLGATSLSWMLGSADMSGWRGRVFAVKVGNHSCWFLPTYHPSFLLHLASQNERKYKKPSDPLRSKFGHCFKLDIEKAFRLAAQLPPPKIDTPADARAGIQAFNGIGGYPTLIQALNRACEAPIKAVDIETSGLRPYAANARILTCSISYDNVNFSFAIDHPKSGWSTIQRGTILEELAVLLSDHTIKVAHNAPFEIEWLVKYFGKEIVKHNVWECTQMQAHMLDERRNGQGLDDLCRQHFGIAYKSTFKLDIKNMAAADINETLVYNGADTKYTLRLWHHQNKLLKDEGLLEAYRDALPRQTTVALMQHFGIGVDQQEVKQIQKGLKTEITDILSEIDNLKVIKAFKADNGSFNPQSNPELLRIFKDYLKRPEVVVSHLHVMDFGKASQSKKSARNDNNRGAQYSIDKRVLATIDHPLAKMIVELRNRTKLKSTYADGFELGKGDYVWPDGNIHTSFNTTFTETGRLSSDYPNQQNWPKRNDAWVRKLVVAPKGHVILAFDYGQLEGCCAAMCSRDSVLVRALWENYDIHMEWTKKLVKRYPLWLGTGETLDDKATAKKYRGVVKNKLVFPAIYGAGNDSIAGYLNIPIDVADDIMDEFWGTFIGLKRWQDMLMKGYYNCGYVASLNGRRHNYPLTRNQAINFPVQSVAADIVCESMNMLSRYAVATGEWHMHPILNIHDDLTFIVPAGECDRAIKVISEIMLTPPYKFINVPLSVEVSVGDNWFEMKEVTKLWSNKDV